MNLTDLSTIKSILAKHKNSAKKFLGQNFLTSQEALDKIVEAPQIKDNEHILEIGPGLGVLTRELAKKAKKVTSIELDKSLFPILEETLEGFSNIELVHADALRTDPPKTAYKVVANIPYNITSPLINHYLQAENKPESITILIQKEVAEKIVKLTPDMTVLSLQVALFGEAKIIDIVKSDCFHPAPKVDSAIIHIKVHKDINVEESLQILKLAKRAFRQRRKKLSNTLRDMKDELIKLGLEDKRPQHLEIDDWRKFI